MVWSMAKHLENVFVNTIYCGKKEERMLKEKRKEKGFTQKGLAEASGLPFRTIQNWEQLGIDHATVGNLKKVAKALGCKPGDLIGE